MNTRDRRKKTSIGPIVRLHFHYDILRFAFGEADMSADELFQQLLQRVRDGDNTAAAEVMRAYEQEVRRAASVQRSAPHLRGAVDTDDLAQTAFRRLFEQLNAGREFNDPAHLRHWLLRVIHNRKVELLRLRLGRDGGPREAQMAPDAPQPADVQSLQPDRAAEDHELHEILHRLLSGEDARLVELRVLQGRRWREMAELMNQPLATVRQHTMNALRELRAAFRE
jgi:RNA polymerase sigma-70 factor (ECF subfamily)